ncbi:MAG TPA: LamG-like jellyroll fold domain-containing protein [Chthoniobacteraceae bacterium]|nr:LamG-like jellyroll fold domain-containing protein [Chthoniobacteraceae bacterium]
MNEERLDYLLDRYFDEALTAEEKAELESLLLSWPQARTLFWKRARFNALLRRRGRENWGRKLALGEHEEKVVPFRQWTRWWPLAAAAAIIALLVALNFIPKSRTNRAIASSGQIETIAPGSSPSPDAQGVATILRAVGVKWKDKERLAGNVLKPGWLKFESGWIEVEFHRGARVVIEGPAEFELITDMQARCLLGKVRAEVPPPATGFEVLSPNVRVVDRGTSFGLEVTRDGPSDIHVFSGKVDLATTRVPEIRRELNQGSSIRVDTSGVLSDLPKGDHEFATTDALDREASAAMASRFKAWQDHSEAIRTDPSLVVQYAFDSFAQRRLENKAPKALADSHGTIIGCSATEGRWPGKRALDFKQIGDRVRLALPLQYKEMTCVTWIRLDALDRLYSALLMSGDAAVGELQWQLGNSGKILFGKRKAQGWGPGKLFGADSRHVLSSQRCGSWMQIAFVYDSRASTVTHYLDGRPLNVMEMDSATPLTTRALEIGNWTPTVGDPIEPIRAFNGRMDEFLLFSRALRPEEIQRHWEAGRPL